MSIYRKEIHHHYAPCCNSQQEGGTGLLGVFGLASLALIAYLGYATIQGIIHAPEDVPAAAQTISTSASNAPAPSWMYWTLGAVSLIVATLIAFGLGVSAYHKAKEKRMKANTKDFKPKAYIPERAQSIQGRELVNTKQYASH